MQRIKRWLSGILSMVLLLGLLPATALAAGETLSDGTDVTSTNDITRAQLAEMVYEHDRLTTSIELMGDGNSAPNFTDITECTDDQKAAITALAKAQIISGTSEDEFSPGGFVTRGEAVVVIWRATGSRSNKTAMEQPFTEGVEPWYEAGCQLFLWCRYAEWYRRWRF